jgi:HSP20 family protein
MSRDTAWRAVAAGPAAEARGTAVWLPPADIVETPSGFQVTLEICGVPRDGIVVQTDESRLTVSGERPPEPDARVCHHRERPVGRFARSFAFRVPIDSEGIRAALADGVLTLEIPKREPMRIAVE